MLKVQETLHFVCEKIMYHVSHHVGHHVSHHVGHHNVVSTLCVGSETLTGLGAIDTCATKKLLFVVGSFLKRRLSYIIM